MNIRNIIPVLLSMLLLSVSPARADNHDDYPYYGGFAIGFPGSDEECDYHGYDCDGSDTSFKIYAGKRFHENLAFEISFQDLGKLRDEEGPLTTTAESSGINFSLHGIIPVFDNSYFYGKVGYMLWDTDYTRIDSGTVTSSDDGSDFTYGMGFAFGFNDSYDLRIEFERLNDLNDDFVVGGSSITSFSFGGTIYID